MDTIILELQRAGALPYRRRAPSIGYSAKEHTKAARKGWIGRRARAKLLGVNPASFRVDNRPEWLRRIENHRRRLYSLRKPKRTEWEKAALLTGPKNYHFDAIHKARLKAAWVHRKAFARLFGLASNTFKPLPLG